MGYFLKSPGKGALSQRASENVLGVACIVAKIVYALLEYWKTLEFGILWSCKVVENNAQMSEFGWSHDVVCIDSVLLFMIELQEFQHNYSVASSQQLNLAVLEL